MLGDFNPTTFWILWFLQMNMHSKGKTSETRQKPETSDLLRFQKRLEDRIQLFEQEKDMERGVMNKVKLFSLSFLSNYLKFKSLKYNKWLEDKKGPAEATEGSTIWLKYIHSDFGRWWKRCAGRERTSCSPRLIAWLCKWPHFIIRKLRGGPKFWRPPKLFSPCKAISLTSSGRERTWRDMTRPRVYRATAR